jgi:hypothetical protein
MIQFNVLEQIVSHALKSVELRGRDGELKPYTKAGGQAGRGWRVAGFYVPDKAESRLVFEGLHYETPAICVVRVYRENPLEVLFARKWAGDISRFEIAAGAAATAFYAALPTAPVTSQDGDDSLEKMPLSPEERELISSVLQPIPPPCNLAAIEEA